MWRVVLLDLSARLFNVLETSKDIDVTDPLDDTMVIRLASRRAIKEECRTIWTSLLAEERYILKVAAKLTELQGAPDSEAVNMLMNKKLLAIGSTGLEIKPALFRAYVMADPEINE